MVKKFFVLIMIAMFISPKYEKSGMNFMFPVFLSFAIIFCTVVGGSLVNLANSLIVLAYGMWNNTFSVFSLVSTL